MTKHIILFLAANPLDTDRLALDREARAIQGELERSGYRDFFDFETRWAAEPLDLLRELRKLRPTVVHYSGHGGSNGLFFQTADGHARVVSTAALADLFGAAGRSVKLVVLNACYSETQADALVAHVDCVVGMGGSIRDGAAGSFAAAFYGGLGERESVAAAFKQGCAAISLEEPSDIDRPRPTVRDVVNSDRDVRANLLDGDRPRLKVRDGVDANQLVLATNPTLVDALGLRPRGRRKLVGAIGVVLVATLGLATYASLSRWVEPVAGPTRNPSDDLGDRPARPSDAPSDAAQADRQELADLAVGTYYGGVIAGGTQSDVTVEVVKLGPRRVRVSSDYQRLGAAEVNLTHAIAPGIDSVMSTGSYPLFLLDRTKQPPRLDYNPDSYVVYVGVRRQKAVR